MIRADSKKILIADDDDGIRRLFEEVLTVAGYEVEMAVNGMEGLEMLKRGSFDLVISDLNMPEVSGIDFYINSIKRFPYLKDRFIFCTSDLSPELRSLIREANLKCIPKPFRIVELIRSVEDAMKMIVKEGGSKMEEIKRQDVRFSLSAKCAVFEEDMFRHRFLIARTENLSNSGIKVVYEGGPIPMGTPVSIYMSVNYLNVHRNARIVWSRVVDERSCASGLMFEEQMPVESVVGVMATDNKTAEANSLA